MPFPRHVVPLIHTCHAAPLPCSDSAVSFAKFRMVAGNIRTASPADEQIAFFVMYCYHSLQSQVWIVVRTIGMLLITIFVERRVIDGRSRTREGSPQAVSRRPCCAVALRRMAWSERGMACVNQTQQYCVNQMGETHSKPLAARHGRETAWARHAMCESAFRFSEL